MKLFSILSLLVLGTANLANAQTPALSFLKVKTVPAKLKGQLFCEGHDVVTSDEAVDCGNEDKVCYLGEASDVLKILEDQDLTFPSGEYEFRNPKVVGDIIQVTLWDGPNESGSNFAIARCAK
ncbi:MAG TPA: hypothetical protein VM901_13280 [Bdellovibrionota bacterium]|nr:hypothetical protein [Bdellovibrionota bacterium]